MNDRILNSLKMQFLSTPENVSLARVLVASFGAQIDLTINDLEELKVATSEAVSNAIIHGYRNSMDEWVELNLVRYPDRMEITVIDTGVGIEDISQALQPSFSTVQDRMGLGFVFMQSFMDSLEVFSQPNEGTKVVMIKKLTPQQGN